jgi:sulfite exporter TauE/SafE/copper chaperone CopZ
MAHLQKTKLKIHGTHCASCEVLVERKFKKLPGVEKVNVSFVSGKAEVFSHQHIALKEFEGAIKEDGYSVSRWEDRNTSPEAAKHKNSPRDYAEIGAVFLFIVAAYLILKQFNLIPESLGVTSNMSYGFVFLIGLVAATSTCLAVAGGLLLAAAAKYNELYPDLTGYQKFKPTLYFNAGRLVSYTFFGGLIGALGSMISLSARGTGILSIIASLVMIILGFQLLNLFPWMRRLQPRMPKFISHKIHDLSGKDTKGGAFVLGALTFFLPCGFTLALQLYVLSTGSLVTGALTMLAFSLGTLPMLLSLSALSSFAKGSFQKHFLRFSAVLVVLLGFWNINNGLTLTGFNFAFASSAGSPAATVPIQDGKQIVKMTVSGYNYSPSQFTVVQGVPVEWQIDNQGAAGCGQVLVMPTLGLSKYLSPQGITTVTFTPTETGTIPFNCAMGMMTRGASFTVVANTSGTLAQPGAEPSGDPTICDPTRATCVQAQQVSMEVSRAHGFWPQVITVKNNVPVELNVDDQINVGGCMGVMTIPEYGVSQLLAVGGKNVLKFTPTHTGTVNVVCPMGGFQTSFDVVS